MSASGIHAVIMAGGRGTRFWPASRESLPKQFLPVAGPDSLLTRTGRRLAPLVGEDMWVVTGAAHAGLVREHLPELRPDRIVGEPVGRNTAPCIALAAALVLRDDPDGVLLVAPADHWIGDEDGFRAAAETACAFARERRGLVTFGIVPASPETGYGYIETGEEAGGGIRRAARFTEKPDDATARGFLAGGRHLWNSGIFAWRADVFLEELAAQRPAMAVACRAMAAAPDLAAALGSGYAELESISVDYAVLESSANVYVLRGTFGWSDIGSWNALADHLPADPNGNAVEGDGLAVDSRDCLLRGSGRLIAAVGVENLLIVDTPDALLVCSRSRAQDVKKVVETLERSGRRELL